MTLSARSPRAAPGPEWEVLLVCARTCLSAADRSRLQSALAAPIDWTLLFELALHHDLTPLLLHALETVELPPSVSASILPKLQRARAAHALRNTLLFRELTRVLDWARSRRIDVVVLKGGALAEDVYGDPTLRPMRDLDLLFRPEHVADAEQFLTSCGYGLDREWARAEGWHRQHDYHLAFRKRPEGLPALSIELHWHLVVPSWPCRPDLDGIWARAVPATIAGIGAMTLSPDDTLLHLCLHACKHKLTAGLRPLCDIAEVIRHHSDRIDWAAVIRRALQWRTGSFTYVPLLLARELLGASVPDRALDGLAPTALDRQIVRVAAQVIAEHPLDASLFPDFFGIIGTTSMAERRRALAKVFARDVVAARYGMPRDSLRLGLRYPQRLVHLFRSYGPRFWRFLRFDRGRAGARSHDRLLLAHFLRPLESMKRPLPEGRFARGLKPS